jgi:hypothetical protein
MAVDWTGAHSAYDTGLRAAASDSLNSVGKPLGRFTNLLGAVVSLALISGVGVWGYKLFMRDVSGVPVVRALEGEMRVAPKNPGGEQTANQGLAVNSVAADGSAEAPAQRLILAPRPVELAEEDKPIVVLTPANTQSVLVEVEDPDVIQASVQANMIDALVAELTNGVAPLSTAAPGPQAPVITSVSTPEPADEEIATETAQEENPLLDAPGLKNSLRPRNRPVTGAEVVLASVESPVIVASLDPENIPVGTRMVQLGAYDSEDVAQQEWARLSDRFEDYLEGKQSVIQRASSGGRVFYRLRAVGFEDLSDARRFCSALVAENADCIPVVSR